MNNTIQQYGSWAYNHALIDEMAENKKTSIYRTRHVQTEENIRVVCSTAALLLKQNSSSALF